MRLVHKKWSLFVYHSHGQLSRRAFKIGFHVYKVNMSRTKQLQNSNHIFCIFSFWTKNVKIENSINRIIERIVVFPFPYVSSMFYFFSTKSNKKPHTINHATYWNWLFFVVLFHSIRVKHCNRCHV